MQEPTNNPDHQSDTKKPSSARRILSSQANGKKSKGPITPAGRLKCAKNPLTHGLLSETIVLPGESKRHFEQLLQSYVDEHRPITPTEVTLVYKMTVAIWRQMRSWSIHTLDISCGMARENPDLPAPFRAAGALRALAADTNILQTTSRYEAMFDRQFKSCLSELEARIARRGTTTGLDTLPAYVPSSTWATADDENEEETGQPDEKQEPEGK